MKCGLAHCTWKKVMLLCFFVVVDRICSSVRVRTIRRGRFPTPCGEESWSVPKVKPLHITSVLCSTLEDWLLCDTEISTTDALKENRVIKTTVPPCLLPARCSILMKNSFTWGVQNEWVISITATQHLPVCHKIVLKVSQTSSLGRMMKRSQEFLLFFFFFYYSLPTFNYCFLSSSDNSLKQ